MRGQFEMAEGGQFSRYLHIVPNLKETALEYELKALEQIVSIIEHPNNLKPGKQDTALPMTASPSTARGCAR